MNSLSLAPSRELPWSPARWREGLQELLMRERSLAILGIGLWLAMLPLLPALALDERMLRGVSVWAKPLKFLASVGLFALSTAWFIGLLPVQRRRDLPVRIVVWTIVAAGLFEVLYIGLMASLGLASHFNYSGQLTVVMYSLMGVGAMAMTATQALLAWHIARHGRPDLPAVWRQSVLWGLVLTFALGASSGALLGGIKPPDGAGLPILGWHLAGGDLRPAHFLGLHAQQLLPVAGLLLLRFRDRLAQAGLLALVVLYVALWIWAMLRGLSGAVPTPPPGLGG